MVGVYKYSYIYSIATVILLQTYLTEEDFQEVFGISVFEYKALPKWKQDNLKKKVDLY